MYSIKRRRLEAPLYWTYASSFRRGEYAYFEETNRSVRGPALASTTRESLGSRPFSATTPRYPDAVDRIVSAELAYSREVLNREEWTPPRTRPARSYVEQTLPSASSPLPGLSQLLYPPPVERSSKRLHRDDDCHEDDVQRNTNGSIPRAYRQSASQIPDTPLEDNMQSNRLRRITSDTLKAPPPTSASTPLSDSMDSTETDVAPIHPLQRRPPASLQRTESVSSRGTTTPPPDATDSGRESVPSRTLAKSSRYLREIDRRNILQRIENGEKQATLAKEYQVSRAAICNLNKHRDVVLSRKDENPLAKHPKKPRVKGGPLRIKITCKPTDLVNNTAFVYEMKARSIALLLTLLRCPTTQASNFRRYADRLLRLIVEEALAVVPVQNVQLRVSNNVKIEGVQVEQPTCAVALEASGGPHFLRVFHAVEPHQPTGSIRIRGTQVDVVHLPPDLESHNVFLFDLFTYSAESISSAIGCLIARGVRENGVWLVSLCIAYEVAELVHSRFPHVKIVTAQVDRSTMPINSSPRILTTPPVAPNPTSAPITKPDISTKVLVQRFLQAYEPKRVTRTTLDPNTETQV